MAGYQDAMAMNVGMSAAAQREGLMGAQVQQQAPAPVSALASVLADRLEVLANISENVLLRLAGPGGVMEPSPGLGAVVRADQIAAAPSLHDVLMRALRQAEVLEHRLTRVSEAL